MGKNTNWTGIFIVLAIIFVGGGIIAAIVLTQGSSQSSLKDNLAVDEKTATALAATCPDDGDTSLKIDVVNKENTTGSEGFDVTGYLYKVNTDGSLQFMTSITDTTSPSATTVDCGYNYKFMPISADGSAGDNSLVQEVKSGDSDAKVSDGSLVFFAQGSSENIVLGMSQHAVLEVRAYDNLAKGLMYDSSDSSASDWETDGVTFTSITNNATAYSEVNGVDVEFDIRATISDGNFNDNGFYILLDNFDTNVWEEPAVIVNGVQKSDYSGKLNDDEKKAYTGYDYVYFVEANTKVLDAPNGITLKVKDTVLSGATASADLQIDIVPVGRYLSTDGFTVGTGSVQDNVAKTTVFAIQDINIDITE